MADPATSVTNAAPAYTPPPYVASEAGDYSTYQPLAKTAWAKDGSGEDGLTFADFLDAINPLQHLPIISIIYRAVTGEKIGMAAKLIGDTLYGGGPAAFLASGITSAFESSAGKTASEMLADIAHDVFGPSSPASGDAPAATQEARAHDSEQAHEDELGTLTQVAMTQALPVAAPPPAPAAETASAPKPKPETVAMASGDDAAARIAKTVADAQRAQAGLLLASVQQPEPRARPKSGDDAPKQIAEATPVTAPAPAPARAAPSPSAAAPVANPFVAPDRAGANWTNESLADTIARYERAVAANRR